MPKSEFVYPEWYDIAIAPKDGRKIIGYRRCWTDDMTVVFYDKDWDAFLTLDMKVCDGLTHWTPLPPKPVL